MTSRKVLESFNILHMSGMVFGIDFSLGKASRSVKLIISLETIPACSKRTWLFGDRFCYISDINVFLSIMCKRLVVGLGHGKLRINKKY
jgi:hypothetical protein